MSAEGTFAGEPLHFRASSSPSPDVLISLAAVPIEAGRSVTMHVVVRFRSGRSDSLERAIPIPKRAPVPTTREPRRARRLAVAPVFTAPRDSAVDARIARENAEARAAGRRAHDTPQLWSAPFMVPRASKITSRFGAGRLFNGQLGSSHAGVDFAGAPGDPVRASNRGVVAIVDSFFLAGNVVYVDHGAGVLTGYFHLTRATVAVGDTVARGQVIGLVGATGRVTGPHLHWSARYGALTADPLDLVALTRRTATRGTGGARGAPAARQRPMP